MTSFKLTERAMLADINIGAFNPKKVDKDISQEVVDTKGAASDAGTYVKNIIGPHYLKTLTYISGQARLAHYNLTFPGFGMKGPRILATVGFDKHIEEMGKYRDQYEAAVKELEAVLPTIRSARINELGSMWKEHEFPGVGEIISSFYFDIKYYPMPEASNWILDLDSDNMDALRADIEEEVRDTLGSASKAAFIRALEAIEDMRDRLTAYEKPTNHKSGSFKSNFRKSLVSNMNELAETLPFLNIAKDPELDALSEKIKEDLCSMGADELKESKWERDAIAQKADDMAKYINSLLAA